MVRQSEASFAELEDLSEEPRERFGLHRLLRRTDREVPVALRFCGAFAQSTPARPFRRNFPSHGRVDGTAAHGSVFLGHRDGEPYRKAADWMGIHKVLTAPQSPCAQP